MIERALNQRVLAAEPAIPLQLGRGSVGAGEVEAALKASLVRGGTNLVSDETAARVASMLRYLAARIHTADGGQSAYPDAAIELASVLTLDSALLTHLQALALEFALCERLRARFLLDPVSSPLLLRCLASEGDLAALAARVLQAQACFMEAQRRMELTPADLPRKVMSSVLSSVGRSPSLSNGVPANGVEDAGGRQALLQELLAGRGGLTPDMIEMGPALFLTAVASGSGRERDEVALATAPGQQVRFALMLRAAGMDPEAIDRELSIVHGAADRWPTGVAMPDPGAALVLLQKAN